MRGEDERRTGKGKRTGIKCIVRKIFISTQRYMFYNSNKLFNMSVKFSAARNSLLAVICTVWFCSCGQIDAFEKNTSIPSYKWSTAFAATGSFDIKDTVSAYNIYIVLRHTDGYQFNNIWLNVGLQSPGDTMYSQKINLPLGSDAGGWEGTGMNDIWEVRKLLNSKPSRFKRSGGYKFNITQLMRDNPLLNVMSAGLRLEKVK
jgi:gliding motility-associated lipoprotein GldH